MEDGIGIIGSLIFGVIYLGLIIFFGVTYWKIYEKAGKPGWASLIPIYSALVLMEIIDKPKIWVLYMCIPFVGLYWMVLSAIEFAKVFGKDTGFAIGMIVFPYIFLPMIAFGDAQYQGAGGGEKTYDDEILDRG